MENKKLYRSADDNVVAGVCGGLADYFKIDSTLVRIIFVLLSLGGGSGILIYFIMWLVVPIESETRKNKKNDEDLEDFVDDVKNKAKSIVKETKSKKINIFGIFLILIGIVAIWNQIMPFRIDWDFFWPGMLILLGIVFLFK